MLPPSNADGHRLRINDRTTMHSAILLLSERVGIFWRDQKASSICLATCDLTAEPGFMACTAEISFGAIARGNECGGNHQVGLSARFQARCIWCEQETTRVVHASIDIGKMRQATQIKKSKLFGASNDISRNASALRSVRSEEPDHGSSLAAFS